MKDKIKTLTILHLNVTLAHLVERKIDNFDVLGSIPRC